MKTAPFLRAAVIALATATLGTAAMAEGDIYSRLMEMKAMDRNRDGMVSKQEFMAMIARMWDNYVTEQKISGGKMNPVQLKELEKILGRTLGGGS